MHNVIDQLLRRADEAEVGITIFDNENRLLGTNRVMSSIYSRVLFRKLTPLDEIIRSAFISGDVAVPASCGNIDNFVDNILSYHGANISGQFVRKIADGRIFMMSHQRLAGEGLWYQTRRDITKEVLPGPARSATDFDEQCLQARRRTVNEPIAALLKALHGPGALVVGDARIVASNRAFDQFLQRADPVCQTDDCLFVMDAEQHSVFIRHISNIISFGYSNPVLVSLRRFDDNARFFLRMSSVCIPDNDLWRPKRRAVLLGVVDPNTRLVIDPGVLASLMGVTLAEAEVAIALANGFSIQEIAQSRNVSANTVSHQIKSILTRTGLNGKPDIVRQTVYLSVMINSQSKLLIG